MVARAPLFLVLLLLSGCATPGAAPDGGTLEPEWRLVDAAGPGGEPMLAVGPDGKTYLQAVGGTGDDVGESWAWRSDDDGATWTRLEIPADARETTFDGAIAVDPDGQVWIANSNAGQFALYRSEDAGSNWKEAARPPLPPMHRVWLIASRDRLDVGIDSLGGPNFHYAIEDHIAGPAMPVAPNYDVGSNLVRRESDGLLLWPRHESAPMDRHVAWRSQDDGGTWASAPITQGELPETFPATPARRTSIWTPIAFDAEGTAFFALSTTSRGTSVVLLTRSLDGGTTWGPFVALTRENETVALPWLAARENGELAVAAYARDGAGTPNAPDGPWSPALIHVAWPSAADAPDIVRLALPAHVVVEGAICTYGQGCPPEQRTLGEFPAVAFTGDGILAVFASTRDATTFESTPIAITVRPR